MRNSFEAEEMLIKSEELLEEMRWIQQNDKGIESASRNVHDDRVIATALAIEGWKKMLLPELYQANIRWETEEVRQAQHTGELPSSVLGYTLSNFMRQFRVEQ
jgi:hypothetical protein